MDVAFNKFNELLVFIVIWLMCFAHTFVCVCSNFSSSWCHGFVCDCDISRSCLLFFK